MKPLTLALGLLLLASPVALAADAPLAAAEVKALISGRTEQGKVVAPSDNDLGPKGTSYAIAYSGNGTLTYKTSKGRAGTGKWQIEGNALCRSIDGGEDACRLIVKKGDGFVGVGANTGKVRYSFTVK